jgi:hypothetical protein
MTKQEFMTQYQRLNIELQKAKDRAKRREVLIDTDHTVDQLTRQIATLRSNYRRSKNVGRAS